MPEITAALVKTLREKTGSGMMDCKKALHETEGNLDEAIDWLRKKGLAAATKKAGRIASEGLVGVASRACTGVVVEINTETDFVGRNPDFQNFVKKTAEIALASDYTAETLLQSTYIPGVTIQDELTRLIALIGENMNLRRVQRLSVSSGSVATYIHGAVAPNLGRIGVLVALESCAPEAPLLDLGKKLAMHIAATNPGALSIQDVCPTDAEREKNILSDQARASGRPEEVIQKMVEGRMRKYYEEVVFLEQTYVVDGKTKVSDAIDQISKEIKSPIAVSAFARFELGEGIEKEETDFVAEVQAQARA